MIRSFLLLGMGLAMAGGVQAQNQGQNQGQNQFFTIPRVEAHTLGLSGVTRRTLMAGRLFGGGGLGGGGGGGGLGMGQAVNPNPMAARMMLLPESVPGAGGVGTPPVATLVTPTGQVVPVDATAGIATVTTGAAEMRRRIPVARPQVMASKVESAEVKDARLLAHQQEQARSGSPSAQWALAQRYERGQGVEASAELAAVWKTAALRSGYQP